MAAIMMALVDLAVLVGIVAFVFWAVDPNKKS
jgi:nitrogen fixation-related uncharacterized protein